ncbi:lachesin [Scaptodrosophila lebanonensis]|uniref:Lachesin n=1 Tax=Drosophila lebanonensis TaxID=7225 RepID=A0A6J2UGQ8_DROLE|nr:lachesin [Scaptodrosophila lebanonensis]
MRNLTWLLFLYLSMGILYKDRCNASPLPEDYQEDEDYYDDDDGEQGTSSIGPSVPSSPPYFEQTDILLNAKPGDDVIINCDVRNYQISNAVMWYKNSNIVANGQNALTNRVESMKNNSIKIQSVTLEDADDYYCVVLPQNVRQHTKLQVVGARLSIFCDGRDVTDRSQTFKQGDNHKLECRTNLPNKTDIKWSFNGQRLDISSSEAESGVIVLENIEEDDAGVYQCLGDDGSRDPPHGMVSIEVHYSPNVWTHRHHVNAQAGGNADLHCDYRANPIASSFWLKNDKVLNLSEKYKIISSTHKGHNRTTLIVKDINDNDLGEYRCTVDNVIDSKQARVQLSYNPETPQFEDKKIDGSQVTLHWLVRSQQPLSEAVLDYKLSGSYTWSTVSVIHTQRHNETSGIWKISHQMELTPGNWHARVKTKNTKGWSNFSPSHDFVIQDLDDYNDNSDSDLPPDDLMRAGFGGGGNGASMLRHTIIYLLPGLLTMLLRH